MSQVRSHGAWSPRLGIDDVGPIGSLCSRDSGKINRGFGRWTLWNLLKAFGVPASTGPSLQKSEPVFRRGQENPAFFDPGPSEFSNFSGCLEIFSPS